MRKVKFIWRLAAGVMLLPAAAMAACVSTPDCASLGYTKTAAQCPDGFVRCPWDSAKVYCNKKATLCEDIGKKTCGSGCVASGGCCTDSDCGSGKMCNVGLGLCEKMTCALGDIFYSDYSCSWQVIPGKKPIGIVGYVTNGGKDGLVVALDSDYSAKPGKGIQWGCYGTDLPLTNYTDFASAMTDYSGKSNTDVIVSQCGTNTAAHYCKNVYAKEGVKGWYLPAYGELYSILYVNFGALNAGLGKISPDNNISTGWWHWSSSEYDSGNAAGMGSGASNFGSNQKNSDYRVRCVLAF